MEPEGRELLRVQTDEAALRKVGGQGVLATRSSGRLRAGRATSSEWEQCIHVITRKMLSAFFAQRIRANFMFTLLFVFMILYVYDKLLCL